MGGVSHKPLRILRVIARLNIGGPAIQAVNLTESLSTGGYLSMLVCGTVGPCEGDMSYIAKEKGVKPVLLPELGREISGFNDLLALLALRRIIRKFRPHIVHTHTAKAGTLGRLAAMSINIASWPGPRIRMVHTFHGHIFHNYFGRLKSFVFINIERMLALITDRIVVISPLQKWEICRVFKIAREKKVRVIPLGFDLLPFLGCETKREEIRNNLVHDSSNGLFLAGFVGRLTGIKNHRLLLDALALLKDKDGLGPIKCIIIGDGELKSSLVRYSMELGISDSLIFAGWQKEMPSVYGALDAVVLTSKNEGTPVSIIEAMASARPVIATDVGGVRDLLGSGGEKRDEGFEIVERGILVPSGNSNALAGALKFLAENGKTTISLAERGREFVLQHYSLARLTDDVKTLYREITGNKKL